VANYDGTTHGEQRYRAWGETRFVAGDIPTDFHFTGQREDSYIGLYDYGARWYDPSLNRFTQPDTIVPEASQGVLAWDRYAYVNNSPVNATDPTGHKECDLECQSENEEVDPIHIYDGIYYEGDCWGAAQCLNDATLWKPGGIIGTVAFNLGASGWVGAGGRLEGSIALDSQGNVAVLRSTGGGMYAGTGVSASPSGTITNAPSVDDLAGKSVVFGGQIGEVAAINAEGLVFNGGDGTVYAGVTAGPGANVTFPPAGEAHIAVDNTVILYQFNLFQVLINFFGT
jgi:RHS repeat-associated protein